jgi:CRISPR-associated protein Csb2
MPDFLALSVSFLDGSFHGRRPSGSAEWPPSPLRVYQALVAAFAARRPGRALDAPARDALKWLERLPPPRIVAPRMHLGRPRRIAVPNNDLDVVASAWARGHEPRKEPNELKTLKGVRTAWMLGTETVHYVWPVATSGAPATHLALVSEAAQYVTALGWGIDMAIAHSREISSEHVERLSGEQWLPGGPAEEGLRVPIEGTLDALIERHAAFRARIGPEGLAPVPPFSHCATIEYRRTTDMAHKSVAAFSLLKWDASGFRAFDTVASALRVTGMVRHAASIAARAAGWSKAKVDAFVLGHGEPERSAHVPVGPRRFAYLPLPSIESRGAGGRRVVGSVRRVIVTSFSSEAVDEIAWARRGLSGQDLIDPRDGEVLALLALVPESDRHVEIYTRSASTWETVTPVVLPGYDDPKHLRRRLAGRVGTDEQKRLLANLHERVDGLLRKAIVQSGFSSTLAEHAQLCWRSTGFWPGTEHVSRYGIPDHLRRFPRLHVRLAWRDPSGHPIDVPGPICIGAGRFYGLGLMA